MKRTCLALAFLAAAAGAANADDDSWDGTWTNGVAGVWSAVRVYFAGNLLIGFFWNGDFLLDMYGSMSTSDGVVTITWTRGQAVLTRDGPETAHLLVEQKGKPDMTLTVADHR